MKTLLFERPVWFATDPLIVEEEVHEMEDSVYHRPVLEREVVELLEPKPGHLIVDGTCGGGGHTEALLVGGADVLALDQDPDAVEHVSEQLARFGRRVIVRQANFRQAGKVLDELGIRTIGGALLVPATRKCGARFQPGAQRSARHAHGSTKSTDCCYHRKRVQRRTTDPIIPRAGRGTRCAPDRELDRKDAQNIPVP